MRLFFSMIILVQMLFDRSFAIEKDLQCNKPLVESYGIISYNQAKKEKLIFCPNIQYTCCPPYEQIKMEEMYKKQHQPGYILLFELIKKLLGILEKETIQLLDSGLIEKRMEEIKDKLLQLRLQNALTEIKEKHSNPKTTFKKIISHHHTAASYLAAFKSAFYCLICDWQSQKSINTEKKTITYSSKSCDEFVGNTILFAHLLNNVLVALISQLTEIIARLTGATKFQKLHNLKNMKKAIKTCAEEYKLYDSNLSQCKDYCELFNIAKDNYMFEGYPEFFANTIVTFKKFTNGQAPTAQGKTGGSSSQRKLIEKSVRRLLQKSEYKNKEVYQQKSEDNYFKVHLPNSGRLFGFKGLRILEEQLKSDATKKNEKLLRVLEKKRILAEEKKTDFTKDVFDPNSKLRLKIEVFENEKDEEIDYAYLQQMMIIEDLGNSGDKSDQIRRMREFFGSKFVVENDPETESDSIFSQISIEQTSISEFKTIVDLNGINVPSFLQSFNFGVTSDQIQVSIVRQKNDDTEDINPICIEILNKIGNEDLSNFFKNQMLTFGEVNFETRDEMIRKLVRNFALERIRHSIEKKVSLYKEFSNQFGKKESEELLQKISILDEQYQGLKVGNPNVTAELKSPGNNQTNTTPGEKKTDSSSDNKESTTNDDGTRKASEKNQIVVTSKSDKTGETYHTTFMDISNIVDDFLVTITKETTPPKTPKKPKEEAVIEKNVERVLKQSIKRLKKLSSVKISKKKQPKKRKQKWK